MCWLLVCVFKLVWNVYKTETMNEFKLNMICFQKSC